MQKLDCLVHPRNSCQGAALVEFVISISLLLLIVAGAIDLGLGIFSAHNVTMIARQGVRFAAALPDLTDGSDSRIIGYMDYLKDKSSLPGNVEMSYVVAPPEDPDLASGGPIYDRNGVVCNRIVSVRITATYNSLLLGIFRAGSFQINSSATMRHNNGTLCDDVPPTPSPTPLP